MRTVWFTDLDNTLLHSFKHKRSTDICTEYKLGKEQGYTDTSILYKFRELQKLPNETLTIIPITTRSYEQYSRITLFDTKHPIAVTTNGGRIYKNGLEQVKYLSLIQEKYEKELNCIHEIYRKLHKENIADLRLVDHMFLHINTTEETVDYVNSKLEEIVAESELKRLQVERVGTKLYAMIDNINKAYAIDYILHELITDPCEVICSGDSYLDFCMFNFADKAYTLEKQRGILKECCNTHYTDEDPGYQTIKDLYRKFIG